MLKSNLMNEKVVMIEGLYSTSKKKKRVRYFLLGSTSNIYYILIWSLS